MPQFKFIEQQPNHFVIEGQLTFSSIDKKTVGSFNCPARNGNICIDLSKVEKSDSAGLALMIEWVKQCKMYNTRVLFKNIPEQLLALATLSGFDQNEYFSDHLCQEALDES